jgi:hypothetical protein
MGLISDTVGFVLWLITWPIRAVSGPQSEISDSTKDLIDSGEESTEDIEEGVDEGAQNTVDPVEDSFDAMSEQIFEGIAGPLRGFFNGIGWGIEQLAGIPANIAGNGESIAGFGVFIQNDFGIPQRLVPKDIWQFLDAVGGWFIGAGDTISGFFHTIEGALHKIAGIFHTAAGFFTYLGNLNGWEGILGFLFPIFALIPVSAYVALTASFNTFGIPFTPYQVPYPTFNRTDDAFEGFAGVVLGAELLLWTSSNQAGAFLIMFTGMALVFWAIIQERGSLYIIGTPSLLLGTWLLLGAIKAGVIAMVVGTVGMYLGYRLLVERLEQTGEEQIAQDRDLQLG